jgi:hypothetical protein
MELSKLVCVFWMHLVTSSFWLGHSLLLGGHLFLQATSASPRPHFLTTSSTLAFSTFRLLLPIFNSDSDSSARPTSKG